MYTTDGKKGNLFTFITNNDRLLDLKKNMPISYDMVVNTCVKVINLLKAVPSVTIDNAFVQLDYKTDKHLYTCMIKNYDGAITILEDNEIVAADISFQDAANYLIKHLVQAEKPEIIEVEATTNEEQSLKSSAFVQPANVYSSERIINASDSDTASTRTEHAPEPRKKRIKISITYTKEVSVGDNTFSSVMDQVGKLCEAQPQSLNCGFTLSDTNIAIADN